MPANLFAATAAPGPGTSESIQVTCPLIGPGRLKPVRPQGRQRPRPGVTVTVTVTRTVETAQAFSIFTSLGDRRMPGGRPGESDCHDVRGLHWSPGAGIIGFSGLSGSTLRPARTASLPVIREFRLSPLQGLAGAVSSDSDSESECDDRGNLTDSPLPTLSE